MGIIQNDTPQPSYIPRPSQNIATYREIQALFENLLKRLESEKQLRESRITMRTVDLLIELKKNNIVKATRLMNYLLNKENEVKTFSFLIPICSDISKNINAFLSNDFNPVPNSLKTNLENFIYATKRIGMTEMFKIREILKIKCGERFIINAEENKNKTISPELISALSRPKRTEDYLIEKLKIIVHINNIRCPQLGNTNSIKRQLANVEVKKVEEELNLSGDGSYFDDQGNEIANQWENRSVYKTEYININRSSVKNGNYIVQSYGSKSRPQNTQTCKSLVDNINAFDNYFIPNAGNSTRKIESNINTDKTFNNVNNVVSPKNSHGSGSTNSNSYSNISSLDNKLTNPEKYYTEKINSNRFAQNYLLQNNSKTFMNFTKNYKTSHTNSCPKLKVLD